MDSSIHVFYTAKGNFLGIGHNLCDAYSSHTDGRLSFIEITGKQKTKVKTYLNYKIAQELAKEKR